MESTHKKGEGIIYISIVPVGSLIVIEQSKNFISSTFCKFISLKDENKKRNRTNIVIQIPIRSTLQSNNSLMYL